MTLRVTNSLTGDREVFEPQDDDEVLLYYCGLTTSDPAHLGHARGWVHVDVMHRWLEQLGHEVRHVENFTDVNEKIVARVGEDGDSEAAGREEWVRKNVYPDSPPDTPVLLDNRGDPITVADFQETLRNNPDMTVQDLRRRLIEKAGAQPLSRSDGSGPSTSMTPGAGGGTGVVIPQG